MCMGLGCNAVGVSGCRIIDSPRERLIAILTNSLMPCNGRFPAMIAVSGIFFAGTGLWSSFRSAVLVLAVIGAGLLLTLLISRLLSATLLKGVPSAFTLELPPFRPPEVWRVLYRSVLDRTLFVLGRAAAVAAPAGLLLWLMANLQIGGQNLLALVGGFLDPLGRFMGLDGYILLAFLLGFPANEIVLPIVLLCYTGAGTLSAAASGDLATLLTANGWTGSTAICFLLFSLVHFPCSTTCLTIRKETGSWKWTLVSVALPLVLGILLCSLVAGAGRILQ